jgi:integral membrane protein (TIGR01906 family)
LDTGKKVKIREEGRGSGLVVGTAAWIVSLLVPIVLVLTAVRFLLTPVFLQLEYRSPNFPADPYGFSLDERLYWSQIALEYLLNSEDISFLANLRFADGSPVYNERELEHMVDVKNVVQDVLVVWYVSLGGLIGLGLWAWRGEWGQDYRRGLARGGLLTMVVIGTIILLVLLAFGFFFVLFHEIFFPPGTWVFPTSDTLIRLFPERFWRDAFLVVGGLALVSGFAVARLFGKAGGGKN